jgi:hypothetical protein
MEAMPSRKQCDSQSGTTQHIHSRSGPSHGSYGPRYTKQKKSYTYIRFIGSNWKLSGRIGYIATDRIHFVANSVLASCDRKP